MLFIIKSTKIEELCKENDEKISRNIFITDSDGNILFGISGSVVDYDLFDVVSGIDGGENEGFYFDTVDNGKYMIVYARSRYNDLIFTEIIPQSVAMSKVNNIKQMTCYMVALYFLIGIVSAVSFAKRNSEPFNELAGKLKPFLQKLNGMPDEKTNSDELEYIRNGVDYLKNTVQQTYYELKDIFLERLFNGSFNNLEDLKQAGEKLNLSMDGSFYCVAVMELLFSETWEENIKRKAVQNIYEEISRSLPDFVLGVNLRKFRINFLFTLQSNNKESMDNIMNFVLKVKSSIQRDGRVNAACGIGLVVPSLTDVQFSYEQAIFTLNNVAKKSLKIIQYGDLPDSTLENIFYYPIEMEHKLINSTKAVAELSQIYFYNGEGRVLKTEHTVARKNAYHLKRGIIRHWQLYLLAIPPVAYLIIFKYVPLFGSIIAFKDYNFAKGILGSNWVGTKHFVKFFRSPQFKTLMVNTIGLSLYQIVAGILPPILLAVALNYARNRIFKKPFRW
ncbi:sugar ABC transporter permease [Thermoclostridium stercorarium]|uniref:sugar ABC transporter permease n=1 Tax=Thermoclostridium stercorarium TaxID=1510 RepID=UPI002093676E|nr:sugar ABC transporter permease [Thermoclostridium stercorarium]